MPQPCSVAENTIDINQSSFWDSSDIHWDAHRIGWAVAGGCTILVCVFFFIHSWNWDVLFFERELSFSNFLKKNHLTDDAGIIGYHPTTLQVMAPKKKLDEFRDAVFFWYMLFVLSRNYTNPMQQRQMLVPLFFWFAFADDCFLLRSLRILYMPPVYAIISFFSYRFFRSYTYYSFVEAGTFFFFFNHARKAHLN